VHHVCLNLFEEFYVHVGGVKTKQNTEWLKRKGSKRY